MWGSQELTQCTINNKQGSFYHSNGYTINLPYTSITIVKGVSIQFKSRGLILTSISTGGDSLNRLGFWLVCGQSVVLDGSLEFRCTGTWK